MYKIFYLLGYIPYQATLYTIFCNFSIPLRKIIVLYYLFSIEKQKNEWYNIINKTKYLLLLNF